MQADVCKARDRDKVVVTLRRREPQPRDTLMSGREFQLGTVLSLPPSRAPEISARL